jgi:hypothetical protein
MDLRNGESEFWFSREGWRQLLIMAQRFGGWKPLGTRPPHMVEVAPDGTKTEIPYDDWSGGYLTNDYQLVTEEDACALADALERVLPDVPTMKTYSGSGMVRVPIEVLAETDAFAQVLKDMGAESVETFQPNANPLEYYSGEDGRKMICDFIAFARRGFVIA